MISVAEANRIVLKSAKDFGIEEISLDEALGRIVREPIYADRDFPPYDRVTMDGIAISYQYFSKGTRSFKVAGIAAAEAPQMELFKSESCLEVMTGSIMPLGLDTVIRYEDLIIDEGKANVQIENIRDQQNVHFKGEDLKRDDLIIPIGRRLSSAEIGVCATVSKSTIKVSKLPKAIIISTGDELVPIDQEPLPHQIRRSNVYRMKTMLESYQMEVKTDHLDDDYRVTGVTHLKIRG